jgi:serine/threonine protein kinase
MTGPTAAGVGDVPLRELARQIDAVCDRFEAAWKTGPPPRLEHYLDAVAAPARPELLRHLLRVELAYRRLRGEQPRPQDYQARFPDDCALLDTVFAGDAVLSRTETWTDDDRIRCDDAARATPLPESIGKYRVVERLGRGGQAEVFRAVHPGLPGRDLVVKWARHALPEPLRRQLIEEARVLARLEDPGIVRIHDIDVHEGRPFLVLEHVPGRSLHDQLRLNGPPRPRDAAELVARLARTLAVLHENHVLHLDVKPANILIDAAGRPRLTDFGLAAMPGGAGDAEFGPQPGVISGTLRYMAPEQARGDAGRIGPRTDVFGLGGVLYELLTGRPPHDGSTVEDLLDKARSAALDPPRQINPRVPRALERICLRAMAREPEDRYASAADLGHALRRYLGRRRIVAVSVLAGLLVAALMIPSLLKRPAPLDGDLTLRVWSQDGDSKHGLEIDQPGALPVRNSEMVHLEARLDRPGFIYLIWLDSQGRVLPLYPWDPALGFARPTPRTAPQRALHSPPELDKGWEVDGTSGLETALLLARGSPLPPEVDLAALVGTLPPTSYGDTHERQTWKLTPALAGPRVLRTGHRGLKVEPGPIADPLVQAMERLRPHFDLIQAVRFAHEGK